MWFFKPKHKHEYSILERSRVEISVELPGFITDRVIEGYLVIGRCVCGHKVGWVETTCGPNFCITREWVEMKIEELRGKRFNEFI
jgi:hypothetical protein